MSEPHTCDVIVAESHTRGIIVTEPHTHCITLSAHTHNANVSEPHGSNSRNEHECVLDHYVIVSLTPVA